MDHRLVKIKRLVAAGHYEFTLKADLECASDGLLREDVIESILSAQFLRVKNSSSPWRKGRREQLYIIESFNFEGILIYSKGVIRKVSEHESEFYIIISGKKSTASD
ncbi:MAG: hypothetical protein ABSG31_10940 [Tepidisphaeraceae bacterium]